MCSSRGQMLYVQFLRGQTLHVQFQQGNCCACLQAEVHSELPLPPLAEASLGAGASRQA